MKTLFIVFTTLLFAFFCDAQTIKLSQTIISANYKYLESEEFNTLPQPVKNLETQVLNYNHENELSELYDDEYETYSVSFHVPKGKIIAAYDKNGKIMRTIERYNNVRLPLEVMQAVSKRFPNWGIVEDAYLIKYQCDEDSLKHEYKIKIKNEDQTLIVKTDENGLFI